MAHPIRLVALASALVACAPSVDWRELRPESFQLAVALPCRPSSSARALVLAGQAVQMTMLACSEHGMTFAIGSADVSDPARVGAALAALPAAIAAKLRGRVASDAAARVVGMTPQPEARQVRLVGQRPDGVPALAEVAVFAYGTRVYQAAVLGERLDADLTRTFFASLRVAP